MEEESTRISQSGDEQIKKIVDNGEGDQETTVKDIKGEELRSDSKSKIDVSADRKDDNLKGDSNTTDNGAVCKNEKESSDIRNSNPIVVGNTSTADGSTSVIRTGNSSLSNLLVYSSESSDSSSDNESSSSESESYESPEVSDNDQDSKGSVSDNKKKGIRETARTFGELSLDDLPPVPDVSALNLAVPEHECIHMGNIVGIIDRLVTVESLPNTPAYDLETLLFLDNGKKPLGYVYDVMGPVTNPIYVIRFNTKEEMDSVGLAKGLPVYSAPKTPHTQYVFLKQLMKVKGSDASWMGDNEVPPEHADYSDDEEERRVRRGGGGAKRAPEARKRGSLDRHKDFEKDMNVKNIIDTRLHRIRDSFEPTVKRNAGPNSHSHSHNSNNNGNGGDKRGFAFQPNVGPPVFSFGQPGLNPNVPSFSPFMAPPFGMPMPPFGPMPYAMPHMPRPMPPPVPNVPFMPSIPPPQLPQVMSTQPMPPPPPPIQTMHHTIAVAAPPPTMDMGQQKHLHGQQMAPRMMYPSPPRSAFMPIYGPRVPSVWTFQNRPQTVRPTPQTFCQGPRPQARAVYYPKK